MTEFTEWVKYDNLCPRGSTFSRHSFRMNSTEFAKVRLLSAPLPNCCTSVLKLPNINQDPSFSLVPDVRSFAKTVFSHTLTHAGSRQQIPLIGLSYDMRTRCSDFARSRLGRTQVEASFP